MSLQIVYQDEWLVAVDKPAGHLVHPAEQPKEGDLVTMKILRDQIGQRVYNVHRLDRPTSGVLLFGIDREAARGMHRAFAAHDVKKTYWAVVGGHPAEQQWQCDTPLRKHEGEKEKEARTFFQVLRHVSHPELPDGLSLIEAIPQTGRFHQIRRHLLGGGHPIIGDYRYAGIEVSDRYGEILGTGTRMLLQARSLEFIHPVTSEPVRVSAPPAVEFGKCFSGETLL
ncbi:MAG: RluA family pseudouridine synthase [Akkermansiaceae bacterium]